MANQPSHTGRQQGDVGDGPARRGGSGGTLALPTGLSLSPFQPVSPSDQQVRLLQDLLDALEELGGGGAVHDAVVEG